MGLVPGLDFERGYLSDLIRSTDRIEVPLYQRDYDWDADAVASLMEEFLGDHTWLASWNDPTYLGHLVFHRDGEGTATSSFLVDGQQRISTVMVLLATLLHDLRGSADDTGNLEAEYLRLLTRRSGYIKPDEPIAHGDLRLKMSDKDDPRFSGFVLKKKQIDGRTKLRRAHDEIRNTLETLYDSGRSVPEVGEHVLDQLMKHACATSISISDPIDPLAVFESLNSKAVKLSESDILKNYVMRITDKAQRTERLKEWRQIEKHVDEKMVRFFRAWHLATEGMVRKSQLYKEFKTLITKENVDERMNEFDTWGKIYSDIENASTSRFKNDETKRRIREFTRLGFEQARPILMAVVAGGATEKQMIETIDHLETAYVRLFKTRQARGSVFEKHVPPLCAKYVSGSSDGISELRRTIKTLCAGMPTLTTAWETLIIRHPIDQHFILRRLEQTKRMDPSWSPASTTTVEIEHIHPQNPDEGNSYGVSEDQHELYVDAIGNLCLVLEQHNPHLGNKVFVDKKKCFAWYDGKDHSEEPFGLKPDYRLTHEVSEHSKAAWTADDIKERGRELGELAEKTWPLA